MAAFSFSFHSFSRSLSFSLLLFLYLANLILCLSHQNLSSNPDFDPQVALFGDAEVASGGSHVQLTRPHAPSSGLVLLKTPIKFMESNEGKPTSFSTEFAFSMSAGNGDGLAFVLVPYDFTSRFAGQGAFGLSGENRFLGIEFDTKIDGNVGDLNANHVGIDVGSLQSVRVSNLSSFNLVLNNGEMLKAWIDYDSSSKRLEIRLGKLSEKRPYNAVLAYNIDLLEMWGNEDVFVGIISTNSVFSQSSSVYSWRFSLRKVPSSMHSLPADPHGYVHQQSEDLRAHKKRSLCALTVLAGLIFATGCGALLAFVVLFMWAILISRHSVFPVESQAAPTDFRYEKINVVVENETEDSKN